MEDQTIKCAKIKSQLSAYYDGELNQIEYNLVEEHISECANCRLELDTIRKLSSFVKDTFNPDNLEIPDLTDNILNRLSNRQMVSCAKVVEDLSAFFDGEIEASYYYLIEEHLETCENCKDQYDTLEVIRSLIRLSVESLDVDYWEAVYERLVKSEGGECSFVREELSAYIDKEVEPEVSKRISEHILKCEECHKAMYRIKTVQKEVKRTLFKVAENIDLWPAVYLKLNSESRKQTFALSAIASLIVIVLVWSVLSYLLPTDGLNTANRNQDEYSVAVKYRNNVKSSRDTSFVADNPYDSDRYMFDSMLNTPPSGVVPILYEDSGY